MSKEIDLTALSADSLKNLVANHRAKGVTNSPAYIAAMRELEIRTGRGLDFDKSFQAIRAAAHARRFLKLQRAGGRKRRQLVSSPLRNWQSSLAAR
jgi:hypothetical protein